MSKFLYIIGLGALVLPLWAGENIVLKTGFQLAADRHEMDGGTIRIYSGDGVAEMPARLVARVDVTVEAVVKSAAVVPAPAVVATAPPQFATVAPAFAPSELTPAQLADAVALKYALPAGFVAGVMRAESGFNAAAVSPKGAVGLMQLMPDMARELGVDARQPSQNADGGARYLRDLLAKYEGSPDQVVLALAAYNAGPAAVEKYHGVPPFRETREYIVRVLKAWDPK